MTPVQHALLIILLIAMACTATGLAVRGRWRLSFCFDAYVALGLVAIPMMTWFMAVTLVLGRWHHVPVHPFHAAMLTSFVSYLGVTSAFLWAQSEGVGAATFGVDRGLVDAFPLVADLLAASYWAFIAWRPDSAMVGAHDETLRRLDTATAGSAS